MKRKRKAEPQHDEFALSGMHWMAAGLFIAAGAQLALGQNRGNGNARVPALVRWAPLIAAPLAGAAHALRAVHPTEATRGVARALDGLAIGVGAAGVASSLYGASRESSMAGGWPGPRRRTLNELGSSVGPLTFAATGVLGVILDREEELEAERRASLQRRARIVERLVPKRKPKLERVVVHI